MLIPLVFVVQVGGARDARGERGLAAGVALDEAAHVVAEAPVPLAPHVPVGEGAHLVQAAAVPRLRQQLHLRAAGRAPSRLAHKLTRVARSETSSVMSGS